MPDRRIHRGRHPDDDRLFSAAMRPALGQAVSDLSWLLSRRYAEKSALKLVGDHHLLDERQRMAVMRCSCGDESLQRRRQTEIALDNAQGRPLLLDGYNVLTTIESALAGGVIIEGRDGCYRDMASMHGTFRKVTETAPAIKLLGEFMSEWGIGPCMWYLDRPVSNSARLKETFKQIAEQSGWAWQIELVTNPDAVLIESDQLIATADSVILDRCREWLNLSRYTVTARIHAADIVRMSG